MTMEERASIERARAARAAAGAIESVLASASSELLGVTIGTGRSKRSVQLPRAAVDRLVEVLEALGDGRQPSVMPFDRDLSTSDVADLLGVSRQYVTRLLDDGRIPFTRVGNRRRVTQADTLAYLRADKRRRIELLRELA